MINCMKKVAEILGLKLGETFKITKDNAEKQQYFRLTKEGVIVSVDGVHWSDNTTTVALEDILTCRVKVTALPWKPRDNEYYFIPDITTPEEFSSLKWVNNNVDKYMYKHGLICRTSEEAIRKSKLLMEYFENNCIEKE